MGETIGDILKELRKAKGKTLEDAAKDIGITPSALGNYENNLRVPRDTIKIAIADYYKKPIQKIFYPKSPRKADRKEERGEKEENKV